MTLVNATTGEIVSDLTPSEARDLTEAIKASAETVWSLLRESHQRGAWSALGYSSWREYATTEFGMSQSRAYQLLDQARVITEIEAASSTDVEISEAMARDLKPVIEEAKAAARAAAAAGTDAADSERRVREALDNLRTTAVEQIRPKSSVEAVGAAPQGEPGPGVTSGPGPSPVLTATPDEKYRSALSGLMHSALRLASEFPDHEHNLRVQGSDLDIFLSELRGLEKWATDALALAGSRARLKAVN